MEQQNQGLNISKKSFIVAIAVIACLMLLTYVLTFIIPAGEYSRITDAEGNAVIDTAGGFRYVDSQFPFWKFLLSPLLVLTADGSGTIIAVIIFLLVIGGIFNALDKGELMKYMLCKLSHRFAKSRYGLMAVVTLFFMSMGACIGSFEECVPLVPIVVALCIRLGWDSVTGLGMSILAAGCGFASGVCNPFTVGVAQELAGLPMFSGVWFRLVGFAAIYALLLCFLRFHAKRIEKPESELSDEDDFTSDEKMDKGLHSFLSILGGAIVLIFLSALIKALQDFTMIIVSLAFLAAGIIALRRAGMSRSDFRHWFAAGIVSILPALAMILMASSIKYIMTEGKILDSILYSAVGVAQTLPRGVIILFIYLIVLVMNFFIASGSAKAFLLIPLIAPMAQIFGIPMQLCILAFAFGDGFSNAFYPTNPVLLISIGLADVNYGQWVRYSWKFQFLNLILTSGLLLLGFAIGYR